MSFFYKGEMVPVGCPSGLSASDGEPIGTIISFLGLTAPKNYLICDGGEYSISDYPDLATFFQKQFGESNHFGGDGVETFAVPDMRNLFLRGYHGEAEEQLSGDIGSVQEATEHVNFFSGIGPRLALNTAGSAVARHVDSRIEIVPSRRLWEADSTPANTDSGETYFTSRPVNMAVLYCIKAVKSTPVQNVYSMEGVKVGTWINGEPLYRVVLQGTTPSSTSLSAVISCPSLNVKTVVFLSGIITYRKSIDTQFPIGNRFADNYASAFYWDDKKSIGMQVSSDYTDLPVTFIMDYIKAKD